MRILWIFSVFAFSWPVFAQEYGVMTMSAQPAAPKAAAKPAAVPLPQSLRIDDSEVLNRQGRGFYRHKVCIDGQYVDIYHGKSRDDGQSRSRQMGGRRRVRCKEYTGANTPAARRRFIDAAKGEFNFYNVFGASIVESIPLPDNSVRRFPLDKMQTAPVTGFYEEAGIIYKLILTDKAKIKLLQGYTYDQAALRMEEILRGRDSDALPIRITFYEDYTPSANRAIAVFTFKDNKKYLFDINDLNKSGFIYDIKPDFAVRYQGEKS